MDYKTEVEVTDEIIRRNSQIEKLERWIDGINQKIWGLSIIRKELVNSNLPEYERKMLK